jgi:hypothetical protein
MRRGHTLLWLLAAALAGGILWIVGSRLLGGRSQLVTIEPARYDFGRVMQGQIPKATLTVTNHSDRVVSVMPQPNCSCFAVERGKSLEPLDPGRSMRVHVIFDTTSKPPGPVRGKWITFHLDLPGQAGIIVPLSGEIYRSYDLRPSALNLGFIDGRPRNFEPRVLHLTPMSGYEMHLQRVVSTPDVFDVKQAPGPSGGLDVSLALRKGLARAKGRFLADVRLELQLKAPGGGLVEEHPVVKVQGFWALDPPVRKPH